jgi:hypothetical protein
MVETPTSHPRRQRQDQPPLEDCFDALSEVHDENVYSAIERLVQAGEQVGFSVHDLIRMLQGGITLESLFDVIEVRMVGSWVHRIQGHIDNN